MGHIHPIALLAFIFSMKIGLFFMVIKIAALAPRKIHNGFLGTKRGNIGICRVIQDA